MATTDQAVVVGCDGSRSSDEALVCAVDEAQRRGAPLRLVHSVGAMTYGPSEFGGSQVAASDVRAAGERVLDRARSLVQERAPDLAVSTAVHTEQSATAALTEEGARAALVVVGSHGRGGFAGLVLGSTSASVAAHARCPVVVVRGADGAAPGPSAGRVVVGVDGSPVSDDALRFAVEAAVERGSGLTAVLAWSPPWVQGAEGLGPAPTTTPTWSSGRPTSWSGP